MTQQVQDDHPVFVRAAHRQSPGRFAALHPVVICVAAAGRPERLAALLAALAAQDFPRPLRVVLHVNGRCRSIVEQAQSAPSHLEVSVIESVPPLSHVQAGHARRIAMEAGAALLEKQGESEASLLTTDVEAAPDRGWVSSSLAALDAGADAVGARLVCDLVAEAALAAPVARAMLRARVARRLALWLENLVDPIPGDPWPRHGDHAGAGLAVSLSTYRKVGGCPTTTRREDLGLVNRIRRAGGLVRHAPGARVRVPAQVESRALGWAAWSTVAWEAGLVGGDAPTLPCPLASLDHWRTRSAIRAQALRAATRDGHLHPERAATAAVARLAPDPAIWGASMPIDAATALLRALIDAERRRPGMSDARPSARAPVSSLTAGTPPLAHAAI